MNDPDATPGWEMRWPREGTIAYAATVPLLVASLFTLALALLLVGVACETRDYLRSLWQRGKGLR